MGIVALRVDGDEDGEREIKLVWEMPPWQD